MSVLASRLDRASEASRANRSADLRLVEEINEQRVLSRAGGDESYVARHWRLVSRCRPATPGR
jgi:hypothetical protein